jgi:hypothetical protein
MCLVKAGKKLFCSLARHLLSCKFVYKNNWTKNEACIVKFNHFCLANLFSNYYLCKMYILFKATCVISLSITCSYYILILYIAILFSFFQRVFINVSAMG